MRFLITGAKGQDGQYLVKSLKSVGHEIIEVSRLRSKYFSSGQLVQGLSPKLEDPSISAEFLDSQNPDCILHFAAVHYPAMIQNGESNQDEMRACHVTTTENFLKWMIKNENCKMVVALSSQMYTAKNENLLISEEASHNPSTFYGQTKAEAHNLIRQYSDKYQTNASGAIFFNHTSIRSKANFLFPILASALAQSIKTGQKEITVKNSNTYLDIGSSDEYCDGVISMLAEDRLTDYVFSSGSASTIASVVSEALFKLEQQGKIDLLSESTEPSWCLVGDNTKANRNLSWKPIRKASDVLVEMVNHNR